MAPADPPMEREIDQVEAPEQTQQATLRNFHQDNLKVATFDGDGNCMFNATIEAVSIHDLLRRDGGMELNKYLKSRGFAAFHQMVLWMLISQRKDGYLYLART